MEIDLSSKNNGNTYSISAGVILSPVVMSTLRGTFNGG